QVAAIIWVVVAAVAVGLPDLEQAVGHDGAVGIVQNESDLDALARNARRRELGAVGLHDRAPVERADGLRGRDLHFSFPLAWGCAGAARCRTCRRAPLPAVSPPCRMPPAGGCAQPPARSCISGRSRAADRPESTSG